jgi:hypothetical protein
MYKIFYIYYNYNYYIKAAFKIVYFNIIFLIIILIIKINLFNFNKYSSLEIFYNRLYALILLINIRITIYIRKYILNYYTYSED